MNVLSEISKLDEEYSKYFAQFVKSIEDSFEIVIITQYIDSGIDLHNFCKRKQNNCNEKHIRSANGATINDGMNDISTKLVILSKVCQSINILHNIVGYIHFDISLENVLIVPNDTKGDATINVKLTDFGSSKPLDFFKNDGKIAKHVLRKQWKQLKTVGKAGYRAPELENSQNNNNINSMTDLNGVFCDLWSFGYLMYSFIFEMFPFDSSNVKDCQYNLFLNDCKCNVSKWIDLLHTKNIINSRMVNFASSNYNIIEIISCLLHDKPEQRSLTSHEVIQALDRISQKIKTETETKAQTQAQAQTKIENEKNETKSTDKNRNEKSKIEIENCNELVLINESSNSNSISDNSSSDETCVSIDEHQSDIESNFHALL